MTEEWRPVLGYEGNYEVSDRGQVRSILRTVHASDGRRITYQGRLIRQTRRVEPNGVSRCTVRISKNGVPKTHDVHALVAAAFLGPRPRGADVCHWNGDGTDNRLPNLRYASRRDNILDAIRHGTHSNTRKTHCKWGHPFDEANTYVQASRPSARFCRTCKRAQARASAERLHNAAARVAAS